MEDEFLTPEEQKLKDLGNSMQIQLQRNTSFAQSNFSLVVEAFKQFEARNQIKFEKTLKRVEDFLKKKGTIIPDNWREVYWDWYVMKKLNHDDWVSFENEYWDKIISNEKILIEWARDYTESIDKEFFSPNSEENTPFKDERTKNLFEYIVKKWKNNSANKWGYIWIFIVDQDNGGLTVKADYESYLRRHHGFLDGKANYDSCNSGKRFKQLDKLNKEFLESLDLI